MFFLCDKITNIVYQEERRMQENISWGGRAPRRWQAEALPVILSAMRSRERGLVSAVMGSGKSVLLAKVCASGRGRVLVTVPTISLVDQLSATIEAQCPGEVGRYYTHAKEASSRIVVTCLPSVPALLADPSWPGPPALLIFDECHRSESATILDSYARMAPERALGFTATPFRSDEGQELSLWDRELYVYGVADALKDGVIVPFRAVQWSGADDTPVDAACLDMIRKHARGPGIVNAVSIEDAEEFSRVLTDAGIPCMPIHSALGRSERAATLSKLQSGTILSVCHVNMLSEGVDLPWLRWICLRRVVKSRVRFCQEVGRVLRSHPGKTEAVILDPHDLLGAFSLSYDAILSGMAAVPDAPLESELREAAQRSISDAPTPDVTVNATAAWRRYLRAVYLAAVSSGVVECRVKSTKWRTYAATAKQIPMVTRHLAAITRNTDIPLSHRKMLKTIGENISHFSRGDVSDLISLEMAFMGGKSGIWGKMTA